MENLQGNLQDFRPTLEDLMGDNEEDSFSSSLPTNTPPPTPGIGELFRAHINPKLEKKIGDYKVRTIIYLLRFQVEMGRYQPIPILGYNNYF